MADNYIERKMEELHRGVATRAVSAASPRGAGFLSFSFPPRNVLIAAPSESDLNMLLPLAEEYARRGCHVAVLSGVHDFGSIPAGTGIRKIYAPDNESLAAEFIALMNSWRKLEILVGQPSVTLQTLSTLWKTHNESFPAPGFFTPRVLVLLPAEVWCCAPGEVLRSGVPDELLISKTPQIDQPALEHSFQLPGLNLLMFLSTEEAASITSLQL